LVHGRISGKSRTCRDWVTGVTDGYKAFKEDARSSTRERLERGDEIPLIVVDDHPDITQLGSRTTVNLQATAWTIGLVLVFIAIYAGRRESTRPWYMKKVVVDEGKGKLPEK
jgi:hypothetical protein